MENLLIGIALIVIGIGSLFASLPRGSKKVWFAGNPILAPSLPIFMIAAIILGAVLVTGHVTTIDDITLTGAVEGSDSVVR